METDKLIAVLGAQGKMGRRISVNLGLHGYHFISSAHTEAGNAALRVEGFTSLASEAAAKVADIVIFALPDAALPSLTRELVPLLKPGAIAMTLDPAAARAGQLTLRDDVSFVVVHPCHPVIFGDFATPEERADQFGGIAAEQDIVIALLQGLESDFDIARAMAIDMFSPVKACHRITVEQMAILEPAAAEVVAAMCATLVKAAIDESVKRGVPEAAAESFIRGHINLALSVALISKIPFSEACKIAVNYGYRHVLREDWRKVFEPESIEEVLRLMLRLE